MRKRSAHFRVFAALDMASRGQEGTVSIDRGAGLFEVRPLRRRRTYVLPLSTVAQMVVRAILAGEEREKRAARMVRRGR